MLCFIVEAFFVQLVKNDIRIYERIQKTVIG